MLAIFHFRLTRHVCCIMIHREIYVYLLIDARVDKKATTTVGGVSDLTCFTEFPLESRFTDAAKHVDTILAGAIILTRHTSTVING